MHRVLSRRPSPAMLVALLALFVSLGGSAYAGLNLPKNSVGTQQLQSGAVTGAKLHKGAVTKVKIKNGSVTNAKLADGSITNAKFATGAQAPNSAELGGQAPSAYTPSSLFGSPVATSADGGSDSSCVVAEIKLIAGNRYPSDWHLADGSLLPISSNVTLFSLLGTSYGGNGTTNFALPDLRGAEPKGRGPAGVNYFICTSGVFP